jgi:hypothetical protein
MHLMLRQEVVNRRVPSCSETRKTRGCRKKKWLNTNREVAYQKKLRRTNKTPLASTAEVHNG